MLRLRGMCFELVPQPSYDDDDDDNDNGDQAEKSRTRTRAMLTRSLLTRNLTAHEAVARLQVEIDGKNGLSARSNESLPRTLLAFDICKVEPLFCNWTLLQAASRRHLGTR